jgi:hypothetical protein
VIEKIQEFVDIRRIFTAFDVTQDIRADDPSMVIGHHDVRSIVRGLFNAKDPCFNGMVCTPVIIGQQQLEALCYHAPDQEANDHPAVYSAPDDDDFDDDDDDDWGIDPLVRPIVDTTDPVAPSGAPLAASPDDDHVQTALYTETEGRLNIPSALIRGSLGLKPGNVVYATLNDGQIVIKTLADPDDDVVYAYTVTVRGNVRLSRELLNRLNSGQTSFSCVATDGKIVVS